MRRSWGGIAAGASFVLPSLFIPITPPWIYVRFGNVPVVAGIFQRHQTCRHGAGTACGSPHRHAGAEKRLDAEDRRRRLHRDLRVPQAFPAIVLAAALMLGACAAAGLAIALPFTALR